VTTEDFGNRWIIVSCSWASQYRHLEAKQMFILFRLSSKVIFLLHTLGRNPFWMASLLPIWNLNPPSLVIYVSTNHRHILLWKTLLCSLSTRPWVDRVELMLSMMWSVISTEMLSSSFCLFNSTLEIRLFTSISSYPAFSSSRMYSAPSLVQLSNQKLGVPDFTCHQILCSTSSLTRIIFLYTWEAHVPLAMVGM